MNTILIIVAVIIVLSVIAYFAIPKFRKWILGLLAGLGFIAGVVVTPEIPTDPIDDSIEIPIDTTDTPDDVVIIDTIPEQPKDTIIVKPVPEPEPPKEENKIMLKFPDTQDALTQYLRDSFKKDSTTYLFPEGEYFTKGILPSDPANTYTWKSQYKVNGEIIPIDTTYTIQKGEHGVVRLDDRNYVTLKGNNTTLFNDRPAVWDGDMNGDGISESGWIRNGSHMSQRKFFRVKNSTFINLSGINVRSGNVKAVHKPGRPEYDSAFEFEHFAHIQSSDYVVIEDVTGTGLWGDGVYLRDSDDVYLRNITIDWNGRQGGATISGNRVYIENYNVLNSRRSGWDIEGNSPEEVAENFVVTYSNFNTHLYGLPMGGPGYVKNVLSINNEYSGTPVFSRGDGNTRIRENIIFANSKAQSAGTYLHTKNILIDGLDITQANGLKGIASFTDSKNITIRNLKRTVSVKWGKNIFIVIIKGSTTPKDFKIYNNEVPVYFKYEDGTMEEAEEYNATEAEKKAIPFETSEYIEFHWERLYINGKGWRDEDYEDDGWRPKWYNQLIKNDK
jgi:hypothetical protein